MVWTHESYNSVNCDRPGECGPEKDCLRWHWLAFRQPEQKSSSESRVSSSISLCPAYTKYLLNELERIQKRVLHIICPYMEYHHALSRLGLPTVAEHHDNICKRTFESIVSDSQHKLRKLLPPAFSTRFNLRRPRTYSLPHCKTNKIKNSFLIASCHQADRS